MATVPPRPPKRQRREEVDRTNIQQDVTNTLPPDHRTFHTYFTDRDGKRLTDAVEVPLADVSDANFSLLLNTLLGREKEDFVPYRFHYHPRDSDPVPISQIQLDSNFQNHGSGDQSGGGPMPTSGDPQAVFRVQSVTRLAHRIPGHGKPILCVAFSPATSSRLATGSGDHTARIWDTDTGTPKFTLKGHSGWVMSVSWSPDGEKLATCSMDKTVRIWDPVSGKPIGQELRGHAKPVIALVWQPYHLWTDETPRLASSSKDATVRIWIVNTGRIEHVLSGHRDSVTCVKWGGTNLVYTASLDRTIKIWDSQKGTLVHDLKAHAHRVNHLALSTDFALRTAYFDHTKDIPGDEEGKRAKAKKRFEEAAIVGGKLAERMASASDDLTIFLWDHMNEGTKPAARMLGHQKQVNHVVFSPDGSTIASTGFDNQVKMWNAR